MSLSLVWGGAAFASQEPTQLDRVVVTSSGQSTVYDVAQPTTVIEHSALTKDSHQTLGNLLENLPGVSNASFGQGVGRPVIRGMAASRVKILNNSTDSADVSAMSSDHAPMAELSSARRVEVIQGPATLRYGGGAIGGVVNLTDMRIHEHPMEGISGEVRRQLSSNDRGEALAASVDVGDGRFVLHIDAFDRQTQDYRDGDKDRVAVSDTRGRGDAVGLSWTDSDRGYLGASVSRLEYDYAVPNASNIDARVPIEQTRYEIRGALNDPLMAVTEVRVRAAFNDYAHEELKGDSVDGLFLQETLQWQLELDHLAWAGSFGTAGFQVSHRDLKVCHSHAGCDGIPDFSQSAWDGQMGTDFPIQDGFAFSHGNPMPNTKTLDLGVFWIVQREWAHGMMEAGARVDQRQISLDERAVQPEWRRERDYYKDVRFTPFSLSAAATWVLDDRQRLAFSVSRAQRAPDAEEMFWNGDHHATFSFQLDNAELELETAYTLDVNWLFQGERNQWRLAAYIYEFKDYIYNDLKAAVNPFHGDPVYRHEQSDARFIGAEAGWSHTLTPSWQAQLAADFVRAKLTTGERHDLPRTPPATVSAALQWQHEAWSARGEVKSYAKQNNIAPNEVASDGYTLLNMELGYEKVIVGHKLNVSLQGRNLTNQYGELHTSYLKRYAPIMGRNVVLAASVFF